MNIGYMQKKYFMLLFITIIFSSYTSFDLKTSQYDNISKNDSNKVEMDASLISNFENKDSLTITDNLADSISPQSSGVDPLYKENVATFNVLEEIQSQTPQTSLDINNENLTVEIPDEWDIAAHNMTIDALAQMYQPLSDPNVTEKNPSNSPWQFLSTHTPGESRWGMEGTLKDENLGITGTVDSGSSDGVLIPNEAFSVWYQSIDKPDPELEIHERDYISQGVTDYPFVNEFSTEPKWDVQTIEDNSGNDWKKDTDNPYGGEKGSAFRSLTYNDVEDSLEAYIHAGSSNLTLGNPSLGWEVNFTEPTSPDFNPKKYELIVYWKVENLDYDANDNLSVIARIDNQYVDGRYDSSGNFYNNATAYSIENSINNSEYLNHDALFRVFDITSLIDNRKINHTLDFGIWLENINETNDEVKVSFLGMYVRAIEDDQYDIGDIGFNCDVDFQNMTQMRNWLVFVIFANETYNTWLPLAFLQDIFSIPQATKYVNFNITSRFKNILNSDLLTFYVGIMNLGGNRPYTDDFKVHFDDVLYEPIYKQPNMTKAGFQRWNGTAWQDQSSFYINDTSTFANGNLSLAFRTRNASYSTSFIDFNQNIKLSRIRHDNASASYYIPEFDLIAPSKIYWNVSYDNSDTFNQILTLYHKNLFPTGYNFSIIDLPAWDNLGYNSSDWLWTGGRDPLGENPNYATGLRFNGTNNSLMFQNITVEDATDENPGNGYINGTWILTFESKNYLEETTLVHQSHVEIPFYNGNNTFYQANLTNSSITGNYNISIRAPNDSTLATYPKYLNEQNGNLSESWSVTDVGVGSYKIISVWNDSAIVYGQTTRIGIQTNIFEVWRHSAGQIVNQNNVLNSGEIGSFYFNISEQGGNPLTNGEDYIDLYYNKSTGVDNLWGTEWPPNQYLLNAILENSTLNAEGNYTLSFKTRSVPTGTYEVYIQINYPFYDQINLNASIQIVGLSMNMAITIGGDTVDKYQGYLNPDNYPRVDDDSICNIQLNLTKSSNNDPLSSGQISGKFNGSDTVFYGTEIYIQTQNDADRGLYNITVDSYGLNSTLRPEFFNYTLTLTASVDGYNSTYIDITTIILPIRTRLSREDISPIYEESEYDFYITFENINDLTSVKSLNQGALTWEIKNQTEDLVASGALDWLLGGVYYKEFNFGIDGYHISPGIYSLNINASQLNCENATWIQSNFEIIAKLDSQLELTVSSFLQIGQSMSIQANLTYINGSGLSNSEVHIELDYDQGEIVDIFRTTDENGLILYSQTLLTTYADSYLTIRAYYAGTDIIQNASTIIADQFIKGKNQVNLTLSINSVIQTGYSVNISGDISIESFSDYDNIFVTLAAWFDGNDDNLFFLQQIYVTTDGSFSYITNILPEGYGVMTFFVDYAGTITNEYASQSLLNLNVIEKWAVDVHISGLPDYSRIGETINYEVQIEFENQNSTESFDGMSYRLIYDYASTHLINEFYFDANNLSSVTFVIPQDCTSFLNITIEFDGNTRIANITNLYRLAVGERWDTSFSITNLENLYRIGDEVSLNISASYLNDSCPFGFYTESIFVIYEYAGVSPIISQVWFGESDYIIVPYEIPQECGTWLNITLDFSGNTTIKGFSREYEINIWEKWQCEFAVTDLTDDIRQGYEITFNITGSFINSSCPESLNGLALSTTIDFGSSLLLFPDMRISNNYITLNIPIPYQNNPETMEIAISFSGTSKIAGCSYFLQYEINPRWIPMITLEPFSSVPRQGQDVNFILKGNYSDVNCPESITDVVVSFTLGIGDSETTFTEPFNFDGEIIFNYSIPVLSITEMDMTILSHETANINSYFFTNSTEILPQIETSIIILDAITREDFIGDFSFQIKLIDHEENGIPGQTIQFNLINSEGKIIDYTTAITNSEGMATVTFTIEEVGDFSIQPLFNSTSYFAGTILDSPDLNYNLRVINFWVIMLDNALYIGIGLVSVAICSATVYRGIIVPKRRKRQQQMMEIHRQFTDIENIQYLILSHLETGLSIFTHTFSEIPIDGNLISGFLSAISSFGAEIGSKVQQSDSPDEMMTPGDSKGLEELGYKQFKIIVINGRYVRIAVLLLKSPSDSLKERIRQFISIFENEFLSQLINWTGKELQQEPITQFLETVLNADLLYPHNLILPKIDKYIASISKKSLKSMIIQEAKDQFDYSFKVREMIMAMASYGKKEADTFNRINDLRKDGVVFAVNARTLLLAEEFKPQISDLTSEQKTVLRHIVQGANSQKELKRATKLTLIIPILTKLESLELIDKDMNLTPQGEIIATLLNMMPRL